MNKIKSTTWNGESRHRYGHLKIDGNFTRIVKNEFGHVSVYSSQDTDLTEQVLACRPKWLNNIQKNAPLSTTILGELYYYNTEFKRGQPASYIKTGLANGENVYSLHILHKSADGRHLKSKKNQERLKLGNQLRFGAFAIERGADIKYDTPLEELESKFLSFGCESVPYIRFNIDDEFTKDKLLQVHLPQFRQRKDVYGLVEGFVLKDGNLLNWRKLKEEKTIDCFITGYIPGDGKYYGKVGSLLCSVYDTNKVARQIAAVSGFNDAIRDWLTDEFKNNRQDIINQVIEVEYQLIGSKGRCRHPRFKNWRDDKLAEDCLTDQDEDLEIYWHQNF